MKGLYLLQRYLPFTALVFFVLFCQSDVVSILSCSFFFTGRMGESPTACRKVQYANGGS